MAFTLEIGQEAPAFSLPATDGKKYSLDSMEGRKAVVVVFTCNHCPHAIGTEDRIMAFARDYEPRGVGMLAINSNDEGKYPDDSFANMVKRARAKGFPFLYLHDEDQKVALAYGALRTPHFYVFDGSRKLAYTGRMDDNTTDAAAATTAELQDAVDAVLAGEAVRTPLTNPIGCNVKWKHHDGHWMPPDACDLVPASA